MLTNVATKLPINRLVTFDDSLSPLEDQLDIQDFPFRYSCGKHSHAHHNPVGIQSFSSGDMLQTVFSRDGVSEDLLALFTDGSLSA